jgi:hypothetical protein
MERDDAAIPGIRVPGLKVVKGVTSFTLYLLNGAAKEVCACVCVQHLVFI